MDTIVLLNIFQTKKTQLYHILKKPLNTLPFLNLIKVKLQRHGEDRRRVNFFLRLYSWANFNNLGIQFLQYKCVAIFQLMAQEIT